MYTAVPKRTVRAVEAAKWHTPLSLLIQTILAFSTEAIGCRPGVVTVDGEAGAAGTTGKLSAVVAGTTVGVVAPCCRNQATSEELMAAVALVRMSMMLFCSLTKGEVAHSSATRERKDTSSLTKLTFARS